MKGKMLYLIFAVIVGGLIASIMWSTFTQEGVQDLRGNFKRLAFYRNENNTGPVERIYAVSVSDTVWGEMKKYGEFMPHTKYGNTKVYFLKEEAPGVPVLKPGKENLEAEYREYCLGKYEKDAMGQVSFIPRPFKLP